MGERYASLLIRPFGRQAERGRRPYPAVRALAAVDRRAEGTDVVAGQVHSPPAVVQPDDTWLPHTRAAEQ